MDAGEAGVLALAIDLIDCYVLLDDNKARWYAETIHQKFIGTLGLILRANRSGIIPQVRPILEKVMQTDFRATQELYDYIFSKAGE